MTSSHVYDFSFGGRDHAHLLGGKGANLAEMTRLGLPVPPGFTITVEACRHYLQHGELPPDLFAQVDEHLAALERATGRVLGNPSDPLLVSVRSGAPVSMPGMMETVLNVGLNDRSVGGLAGAASDARFAWDCYRRLIQMFGHTVLGIDPGKFAAELDAAKEKFGAANESDFATGDWQFLVGRYQDLVLEETGQPFPQDPRTQLRLAIESVFKSWLSERARVFRRAEGIPEHLGTAVTVCTMVFGNLGARSGTGVAFTRDPATGERGHYGDYLSNAQGEDVVSGTRNTLPLQELERIDKRTFDELTRVMHLLEEHYRDLCDIEFTVERGKLWILQTRAGKRTPEAAFRIAIQLVGEGTIDLDEALRRVDGAQLAGLMFPTFDGSGLLTPVGHGVAASPGAAVGKLALDSDTATSWAAAGEPVILVRAETSPDDLPGMLAARGVVTSRGGKTSHAAVVARGMGRACVVGVQGMRVDLDRRAVTFGDHLRLIEGDLLSVDGATGAVYAGEVPVVPSPVSDALFGAEHDAKPSEAPDLVAAVQQILAHADRRRRLDVMANADTVADAVTARRAGARGIGLCRTEHMFLGPRRQLVEDLVLATTPQAQTVALKAMAEVQEADFVELLQEFDGLPVIVRLLDPPLHEFLPDITELAVRVAVADAAGQASEEDRELLSRVRAMQEHNPMLGLRGVRLGLMVPGLFESQTGALAQAMVTLRRLGQDPRPRVMIPLVSAAQELERMRVACDQVVRQIEREHHAELPIPIGTMIELPRAALTAAEIAGAADFFSLGTNDLTQTTWGYSRDDVEGSFLPLYLNDRVLESDPFESIDRAGVGRLVRVAVTEGRAASPGLRVGVCGEHAGDPDSIHFFDEVGLDYVSCSPYRVPIARLEGGRAAVFSSPS